MRRCRRTTSTKSGSRLAAQTAAMWPTNQSSEARDPKAQTDAERSRKRAVEDGDGARRTAHQDRLGQCAMHRRFEAWDLSVHQITTPPPNEKNDKKKLDAAKAIDRPNTI